MDGWACECKVLILRTISLRFEIELFHSAVSTAYLRTDPSHGGKIKCANHFLDKK